MSIHPSTVVYGKLDLEEGAEVGPYCLIQGHVKIGKGTVVEGHVSLGSKGGVVEIGANNHFHPGAVIGGPPQDITYKGEETSLIIGDHNTFREFSTVNLATSKEDKKTSIGSHCYLMSYTHIGHDCRIGNNVIIANDSHLGGHCIIDDYVVKLTERIEQMEKLKKRMLVLQKNGPYCCDVLHQLVISKEKGR